MPLNPDRVGHAYPPYRYEVSRTKIREYADATGYAADDVLADPLDVAPSDVVAPPGFAAVFTIRALDLAVDDPELGAHWNLVHTAQRFAFARAVRAGDVLECTARIADVLSRARMERLVIVVDVTDARDGTPVLESTAELVLRGAADG